MELVECIYERHSVRKYKKEAIERIEIEKIISAAILAPSGKNRKPWRFVIDAKQTQKQQIVALLGNTNKWIIDAPNWIFEFLDKRQMYDFEKDIFSCGAAAENIMLFAHDLGYGTCCIGEVSLYKHEICKILHIDEEQYVLQMLIVAGKPAYKLPRKKDLILEEYIIDEQENRVDCG